MNEKMRMLLRDEKGITALETAIILIAFVVVASVFAFTMLSAGTFSTEQGREAVYAGLAQVQGSIELRGGVIAKTDGDGVCVDEIVFTVANVAGGEPIDFTPPTGDEKVIIGYLDQSQRVQQVTWTKTARGAADTDNLLETGELFEITITGLEVELNPDLTENTSFVIEIKPPSGAPLRVQRTTPAYLDTTMDLK